MPKQLLLVRHAKSDWDNPKLSDFNRPLNARGERDAPKMAKRLLDKNNIPEQIVSSPAVRALTTARLFAAELGIAESEIVQEPQIYDAMMFNLLDVINEFDDRYSFIGIFGHNPGITGLAGVLSSKNFYDIPTCGMALIEFPFDNWSMISSGTGELIFYDYPKNEQG